MKSCGQQQSTLKKQDILLSSVACRAFQKQQHFENFHIGKQSAYMHFPALGSNLISWLYFKLGIHIRTTRDKTIVQTELLIVYSNGYASTSDAFLYHCCASQAWVQCLEKKVTPVLAGIVAYLDSCDNLDHLHHILEKLSDEEIYPTWTERAWLSVLQDVCNVNYEELCSTGDKHDLEEFTVACPAAENVPFACKLPFPWIVWELVNKAISEARVVKGES